MTTATKTILSRQPRPDTQRPLDRRDFLRRTACLSSVSIASTLTSLQLTGSVLAAEPIPGDYKALVCIFLYGGNDSYNMLIPYDTEEYANYLSIRYPQDEAGLAIPHEDLLLIGDANSSRNFGLHPSMPGSAEPLQRGESRLCLPTSAASSNRPVAKTTTTTTTFPWACFRTPILLAIGRRPLPALAPE